MELNWSTFILEIINFVILVWLLKHFFYKPVMNIIAKRTQNIQDTLAKAETVRTDAEDLKAQYENRLEDWEKEKTAARQELHNYIDRERKQALEDLAQSVQQEKEKSEVLMQRQQAGALQKNERIAMEQSLAFSTRLLSRLAGPELEAGIIQTVLEDLGNLSSAQREQLQKAGADAPVRVSSAYVVNKTNRDAIRDALADILQRSVEVGFSEDASLLAGIHIDIGSWNLQASLKSELKYFAEMSRDHA